MMIVINACYGGFGLSREAFLELRKMGNETALKEPDFGEMYPDGSGPRRLFGESFCSDISRTDPQLIYILKQLGDNANGEYAKLKIIEIPDNTEWRIEEYDGLEWVSEVHRIWR